jgi:hypothetical protein
MVDRLSEADKEPLKKIFLELDTASLHLSAAVSELGKIAGGSRGYIASLRDYKKLVRLYLQIQSIKTTISYHRDRKRHLQNSTKE